MGKGNKKDENGTYTKNSHQKLRKGGRPPGGRQRIALFRRKGSTHYYFYTYQGEKRIAKSTGKSTKEEAIDAARAILVRDQDEVHDPGRLLRDFAADYFVWGKCPWIASREASGHSFSQGTAASRRSQLTSWVLPKFGKRPIADISALELRNWINSISLSSQSKRHLYYTLKIVFDEAVLAKLIDRNPVKDFGLVKLTRKERDPFLLSDLALLFPDDTAKLLHVWGHAEHAALFMVLAACGLRSGEARALCWKHILGPIGGRYFLLVEQAVKFATNRRIGSTKAGKARPVYLPERARGALEWWRPYCPWNEPGDLIFPSETRGVPMGDQSLRDRLRGAMKRAGVSGEGRNLVVHSFRHGYVTRSKRAMPADLLLLMAGHSDEKIQAGYVHPRLEDQLAQIGEAAGTIEAIWPKV